MIDSTKYIFRPATTDDIPFLVETVIQAEKSNTGVCGMANHFGITEDELRKYLTQMFEEEVDGCELSVSSFFVVEYEGQVVAASGGWLEGANEDGLPSSILKSNLFQYIMPKEVILKVRDNTAITKELSIEREQGTYQFEYSYKDFPYNEEKWQKSVDWSVDHYAKLIHGEKSAMKYKNSVDYMCKIISKCGEKNVKVITVTPPAMSMWYEKMEKEQIKTMYHVADSLTRVFDNVIYYDFMKADSLFSVDEFYNPTHINPRGAKKFTLMLNDSINKIEQRQ